MIREEDKSSWRKFLLQLLVIVIAVLAVSVYCLITGGDA